MAQHPGFVKGDHAGKALGVPTSSAAETTASSQTPHHGIYTADITPEDRHIQPFWLGRQRVYAEFSSPEDEDDISEPGCICRRSPSIEILIFDHATGQLEISCGLDKINNKKHIILRLPDRSTKPFQVYKESITTDAAKCAPVFRVFRIKEKQQPDNMSYKDTVYLNKLNWWGRYKIRTGRIRWLFFINLDRSFSGFSEKSGTSTATVSAV